MGHFNFVLFCFLELYRGVFWESKEAECRLGGNRGDFFWDTVLFVGLGEENSLFPMSSSLEDKGTFGLN